MAKTLTWKECGESVSVAFITDAYANNNLYVGLADCGEDFYPLLDITVNLDEICPSDCAFVDTENNPGIDNWLMTNGIAEPTGNWAVSGFCIYPEFRFNMEKVREYEKDC